MTWLCNHALNPPVNHRLCPLSCDSQSEKKPQLGGGDPRLSSQLSGGRGRRTSEFEASLVYTEKPSLEKKPKNQKNKQARGSIAVTTCRHRVACESNRLRVKPGDTKSGKNQN